MASTTDPLTLTADERATLETYARARRSGRPRAARPRHAAARGRRVVWRDHSHGRLELRDDREMETPVRSRPSRRVLGASQRVQTATADTAHGSAHSELNAEGAPERRDPLVDAV